ncbi:hypothetical protein GCM10018987_12100 [Streptomyces cremeus]
MRKWNFPRPARGTRGPRIPSPVTGPAARLPRPSRLPRQGLRRRRAEAAGTGDGEGAEPGRIPPPSPHPRRPGRQATGAGYVGYSTPETCWTTRMTWQE